MSDLKDLAAAAKTRQGAAQSVPRAAAAPAVSRGPTPVTMTNGTAVRIGFFAGIGIALAQAAIGIVLLLLLGLFGFSLLSSRSTPPPALPGQTPSGSGERSKPPANLFR